MVQGNFKSKKPASAAKPTKNARVIDKSRVVKKGAPLQLPKRCFVSEALDDRALSKAIDKANEVKVAAKLLQAGGKLGLNDVKQKGKDMARDIRRQQLKKKVSKVEERLEELKKKEEGL